MAHNVGAKSHFGIDKEVQQKLAAKWDPRDAQTALDWVSKLSGQQLPADFHTALKDGVALCKAMNAIKPNACKVNPSKMPFMQRENIVSFLEACKSLGMKESDLFVTVDLFEGDNLVAVLNCIFSLSGVAKAKGYAGPAIGVKQTAGNNGPAKFEVSATGSSGAVSRQNMGSYGVQDDTRNRALGFQIVKTTEACSSAAPLLSQHDPKHDAAPRNDKIIRNADEFMRNTGAAAGAGAAPKPAAPVVPPKPAGVAPPAPGAKPTTQQPITSYRRF